MYIIMRKSTQKEIQSVKPATAVATLVRIGCAREFCPTLSRECLNQYWEDKRIIQKEELEYCGFDNTVEGWLAYARYNILAYDDENNIYTE